MPTTSSRRRHYRSNVKRSICRGKVKNACRKNKSCRLTRGSSKRKSYCRKGRNTVSRSRLSARASRSHSKGHRRKTNMYEHLNSSSS